MPAEPTIPGRNPAREILESIAAEQGARVEDLPRSLMQDVIDAWRDRLTDVLETRIGERISAHMSDAELDEFERLFDSGDHDASGAWLDAHAPNHPRIVHEELDLLVSEAARWFSRSLETAAVGSAR